MTPRLTCVFAACVAAAPALADPSGELVTGLSYSSIYGATGFANVTVEDAFGTNLDLDLRLRAGDEGHGARLGIGSSYELGETGLGQNAELFYRISGGLSDWDFESFERTTLNVTAGIGADLSPVLSYRAEVFWDQIMTENLDPALSPLILRDEGTASAAGVGLFVEASNRDSDSRLATGFGLAAGVRIAESDEDRAWIQYFVETDNVVPLFGNSVLNITGATGAIESRGDDDWVPIYDRAFLGGTAPRGFAYGGVGPRDATTGDALGGTQFVNASAEILAPLNVGNLTLGLFADVGAVWNLPGAGMGAIGTDYSLRSSVGLSVNWDLSFGTLSVSYAEPIQHEDFDEVQQFSLSLEAAF